LPCRQRQVHRLFMSRVPPYRLLSAHPARISRTGSISEGSLRVDVVRCNRSATT
jgi:hypothetical protein